MKTKTIIVRYSKKNNKLYKVFYPFSFIALLLISLYIVDIIYDDFQRYNRYNHSLLQEQKAQEKAIYQKRIKIHNFYSDINMYILIAIIIIVGIAIIIFSHCFLFKEQDLSLSSIIYVYDNGYRQIDWLFFEKEEINLWRKMFYEAKLAHYKRVLQGNYKDVEKMINDDSFLNEKENILIPDEINNSTYFFEEEEYGHFLYEKGILKSKESPIKIEVENEKDIEQIKEVTKDLIKKFSEHIEFLLNLKKKIIAGELLARKKYANSCYIFSSKYEKENKKIMDFYRAQKYKVDKLLHRYSCSILTMNNYLYQIDDKNEYFQNLYDIYCCNCNFTFFSMLDIEEEKINSIYEHFKKIEELQENISKIKKIVKKRRIIFTEEFLQKKGLEKELRIVRKNFIYMFNDICNPLYKQFIRVFNTLLMRSEENTNPHFLLNYQYSLLYEDIKLSIQEITQQYSRNVISETEYRKQKIILDKLSLFMENEISPLLIQTLEDYNDLVKKNDESRINDLAEDLINFDNEDEETIDEKKIAKKIEEIQELKLIVDKRKRQKKQKEKKERNMMVFDEPEKVFWNFCEKHNYNQELFDKLHTNLDLQDKEIKDNQSEKIKDKILKQENEIFKHSNDLRRQPINNINNNINNYDK